ncbi:MAG: hypothetical protein ACRC5H_10330 [Treponemataceae bacterium]
MKLKIVLVSVLSLLSANLFSYDNFNPSIISTPMPTLKTFPLLQEQLGLDRHSLPNPFGVSVIYNFTEEKYRIKSFKGEGGDTKIGTVIPGLGPLGKLSVADLAGTGLKPWQISNGTIKVQSHAVGAKVDLNLLPFLQLFALGTYIIMNQSTDIGTATITSNIPAPAGGFMKLPMPVGTLENVLHGWVAMGGAMLSYGYKGFFVSAMISGGYVNLDDRANGINGFVQKPVMYIAPRIGYNRGRLTVHGGVQYVELFGATKGKDLSVITGGLVKSYEVEIEKFPVNFLAGIQFMFMRELGISLEYVGSPDSNGINIEAVFRF